jgi:hypothetical protein
MTCRRVSPHSGEAGVGQGKDAAARPTTPNHSAGCQVGRAELLDGVLGRSRLRRTFASVLLTLGEPVPYVMEQLGHTDPKVTLGIYARVMRRSEGDRARLSRLVDGVTAELPEVSELALAGRKPM